MSGTFRVLRNGVFALATVGALGFGATQAVATPTAVQKKADACSPGQCDRDCKRQFGSFASGTCELGVCSCAV